MKNWKTTKAIYKVTETSRKGSKEYLLMMTGEEISAYLKAKNDMNGYIPGLGGDRSYSCIAVLAEKEEKP